MKKLYIIRHGEAEPYSAHDDERQLVSRGREHLKQQTSLVPESVELLLVSPLVRAQQSADILFEHCQVTTRKESHMLRPEQSPLDVLHFLESLDVESVALVSHNPLVSRIVHALGGVEAQSISLDTGAIVCMSGSFYAPHLLTLDWVK